MPVPPVKKETPQDPGAPPAVPPPAEEAKPEPEYVPLEEESDNEPFEGYTAEELTAAEKEVRAMKPAEYIALMRYITKLEEAADKASPFPEAQGIAFTEIVGAHGGIINITSRARTPEQAVDNLVFAIKHSSNLYNTSIVKRGGYAQSKPKTGASVSQPPLTTSEPSSGTTRKVLEKGTDVLNKVIVGDGFVEFHVGKFKYPMKDSRLSWTNGAQIIADVFSKDLGWTAQHFSQMAKYEPSYWGTTYYVDWEKVENPKKAGSSYYNVVSIHA